MNKLQKDIVKTFFIFFVVFSSVFNLLVYFLLGEDTPFFDLVSISFLLLLFTLLLSKKLSTKISSDVEALKEYASDMSEAKNYKAIIKVEHYLECLETSIYLKNIAKRLSQKEKKPSKK
jgi:hypothetical protein